MGRADFVERRFECSICGATFSSLVGRQHQLPPDPVCGDCGLRFSTEQMRKRILGRKSTGVGTSRRG
jgi:transcription elongation factor Elf1